MVFQLIVIDITKIHTKTTIITTIYDYNKNFDPILTKICLKIGSWHILRNISKSRQKYFLELETS